MTTIETSTAAAAVMQRRMVGTASGLPGKRWAVFGAVPALVLIVLPTLPVIIMSLNSDNIVVFPPSKWGFGAYRQLLADDSWARAFGFSIVVGLMAVILVAAVGSLAAIGLNRLRFHGAGFLTAFVLVPLAMPLVVLGLGILQFFAQLGLNGTMLGIALAHAVIGVPYVFMTVRASLSRLDPALIRSAMSLGAGSMSVLRWVYLPAILPAVLSGSVLAFAISFDEVVIALFLSGPTAITLPVRLFTEVQFDLSPVVLAVSTLLFALVTVIAVGGALGVAFRAKRSRISSANSVNATRGSGTFKEAA